ncbi:DUF397 domain-containing protein [Streptomyces sp. NPDC026206]|uniref:DUF397 domain-containing protein n=1 Tax=Streptomyces sp. NPDC026206 TaxID=3157089 RepID=UPI0033F717EB
MTEEFNWQKSSYSTSGAECLEVAHVSGGVVIRESDEPGVVITANHAGLQALLKGAKANVFGRVTD